MILKALVFARRIENGMLKTGLGFFIAPGWVFPLGRMVWEFFPCNPN